jgi:hypothetical protein
MKISELKQRLKNIKDKDFCYSIAEIEINSLYAIILYYMALETNIDTGHTRKLWIQAINRISNVLSKLIPVPNYDIWKNYIFLNDLKESNFVSVNYGSYGITVKSDDEVWRSENRNIAREGNYPKEINAKLSERRSQYRGILGTDYVEFYVDKLLSEIQYVINGGKNSELYPIGEVLRQYTRRIKEYIETGK